MKQRIITALVILLCLFPFFWFSDTVEYSIVLSALSLIGTFEMLRVFGEQKHWILAVPAYLLSASLPVLSFLCITKGWLSTHDFLLLVCASFVVYLLYLFFVAVMAQGDLKFAEISEIFAAVFYIVASFTALTVIRYLAPDLRLIGPIFIAAWITDVFAYFVGYLFGKHKLIPKVSPKKTVEGSVGGIVFATAFFLLYGYILSCFTDITPDYPVLAISGFVLSIVAQIGDLLMSLIKREHGVKDYGKLFPGHGGVLDRFDSILAVCAVWMMICLLTNPLTL